MSSAPKYSVVVPVYNRPQEVEELLASLARQTYTRFEVVLIEDGSTLTSETVFEKYSSQLRLQYFFKPNSGPGPSRNFGFAKARGEYMVIFDSDCIIPDHYFEAVEKALAEFAFDAWGGPDRGHQNFTPLQQAMGYTMSSILTTGGIRGGKKHVGWFQPRSFNMGIRRQVYEATGGFRFDRYAEDIEFSIRMKDAGFKVGLIPEAYVFHKRRTSLSQFYKQVFNFGRGRIMVGRLHKGMVKLTHWFPTVFTSGMLCTPLLWIISDHLFMTAVLIYASYFTAIAMDAFRVTRSLSVALLSIPSAFIQMVGYGLGFLKEKLK
ncbi:MAG: glycosyltransferase [Azospira oryzae]|nr:MAG: glycosyltransferase [Azospira oryzae]